MTQRPKYNKRCGFEECNRWCREGDIFCYKCYKSLPQSHQNALWSKDFVQLRSAIHLAKEFLYEQLRSQEEPAT